LAKPSLNFKNIDNIDSAIGGITNSSKHNYTYRTYPNVTFEFNLFLNSLIGISESLACIVFPSVGQRNTLSREMKSELWRLPGNQFKCQHFCCYTYFKYLAFCA